MRRENNPQSPQASASTNSAIRAMSSVTDEECPKMNTESSDATQHVPDTQNLQHADSSTETVGVLNPYEAKHITWALEDLARCDCHRRPQMPGFTYVIGSEHDGLVKVGKTYQPMRRLLDLQSMNAGPLTLLGLVHGAWLEELLHHAYASHRRHGEWFAMPSPLPTAHGSVCYGCAADRMQRQRDRASLKRGHAIRNIVQSSPGPLLPPLSP
jgi:hypothetical protein